MASLLKVDKLDPQSGTALEIGTSGDTITIPSGATFTVSGTMNASSITAGTLAIARGGTGAATFAAAGLANTPSFYAKQATAQSITNGSLTKITLGTEVWDTDSAFASDKFTVPVGGAGKYLFEYSGYIVSVTTNGYFEIKIYVNGAQLRNSSQRVYMSTSLTASVTQTSSVMVELADSDYVELYISQDNADGGGGSRDVGDANYKAYLAGCRLIGV